jgi:hypothetical protein
MTIRVLIITALLLGPAVAQAQGRLSPGQMRPAEAPPRDPGPYADTREREAWVFDRISRAMDNGAISKGRGRKALRDLADINRMDAVYRGKDGQISPAQSRDIQARLDALQADVFPTWAPPPR